MGSSFELMDRITLIGNINPAPQGDGTIRYEERGFWVIVNSTPCRCLTLDKTLTLSSSNFLLCRMEMQNWMRRAKPIVGVQEMLH